MKLKEQTNRHRLTKEMKTASLLSIAVSLFLASTLGNCIKCFSCQDSENNPSCRRRMTVLDCSVHAEFGKEYDSCFSMTAYSDKKKIQIKECAMSWGCQELEDILCKNYKTVNASCKVDCCKDDLCNEYDSVTLTNHSTSVMNTYELILLCLAILPAFPSYIFNLSFQ
ncbi:uncharacterized protein [Acropora muricata]|uniref:uncharacterized protein n=1 Tax=Acropora muricata TaxID=159855 RepID=UPI0034E49E26